MFSTQSDDMMHSSSSLEQFQVLNSYKLTATRMFVSAFVLYDVEVVHRTRRVLVITLTQH